MLLHCVDLTFSLTFAACVQLRLMFTLLFSFIVTHCMLWPNWPSSDVNVVCLRELLFRFSRVFAMGFFMLVTCCNIMILGNGSMQEFKL
jgi:hypothetical protein